MMSEAGVFMRRRKPHVVAFVLGLIAITAMAAGREATAEVADAGVETWPMHTPPSDDSAVAAYGRAIKLRPSYGECLKKAAGETPGIRDCMNDEYTYQDKRLGDIYNVLIAFMGEKDRLALRREEREWIAFRDRYCAIDPDPNGGQGIELDHGECLLDQTADRATELESRTMNKSNR